MVGSWQAKIRCSALLPEVTARHADVLKEDQMSSFDIAVIGLGAMGSASLYAAARRGQRVLGLERYEPGHFRSSSFGESRLIRLAYFEDPSYVPLVQEAYARWRDLEAATGQNVLMITGAIEAGFAGAPLVVESWRSSTEHNLASERLTARQANARFPAFDLPDDWDVIFQPDAGVLLPEKAIRLFVAGAEAHGAMVRLHTRVISVEPIDGKVQIVLEGGERFEVGSAVISAGAWIGDLLPDIAQGLRLTRQPLMWFKPLDPALVRPDRMPAFLFQTRTDLIYGLPDVCGTGVKAALHDSGELLSSAEEARGAVSRAEVAHLQGTLRRYVPAAAGTLVDSSVCIYTRSPDGHFLVGLHPKAPQLVIASPCSGHGFKFASVMGEILADLAINRKTDRPIDLFNVERLHRPKIC
jgi:sarcosine oxidase